MDKNPILKEIAIGGFYGSLFAIASRLKNSSFEQLLSAQGATIVLAGAISGACLYLAFCHFWLDRK